MKNYKDQTPRFLCANCNLCYIWCAHDEIPDYFCTDEADPRPVATVGESLELGKEINYDEWDKWASQNRVSENGICEHYEAT